MAILLWLRINIGDVEAKLINEYFAYIFLLRINIGDVEAHG